MGGLSDRIRGRRRGLGWTQDELARRAGISKGFVSDLENGKRRVGADLLLDIAEALGVTLDYLMKGGDPEDAAASQIEIPSTLAKLAGDEDLTFAQTLALLRMRAQIIAQRTASKGGDQADFDWRRFYKSVEEFL